MPSNGMKPQPEAIAKMPRPMDSGSCAVHGQEKGLQLHMQTAPPPGPCHRRRLFSPRKGYRRIRKDRTVARPVSHRHYLPQHFLYLRPLPQGQGSLRPTFGCSRR